MTYEEIKQAHCEELNSFEGIFFAFNNDQFRKGMEKVGLAESDTDKIYSIRGGGFLLKSRSQAWHEMFARQDEQMKAFRDNREELIAGLIYELANHEYCITGDPTDAVEALGLTLEEIDKAVLKDAIRLYSESQE